MAERLNTILNNYVAQGTDTKDKLLGAAFLVVNKDGTLFHSSAGRNRLPPSSPPFTPRSTTWLASMTKLLTTTCLMQVVERGHLTLDQDLRPLVPELATLQILTGFSPSDGSPILVENKKAITLRQLLTHTSGLGVDIADPDLIRWSKWVDREKTSLSCTMEGLTTPLKFAPGEGWYYGSGTDWAGVVLERVVGERLGEYMEREVWGRLGMGGTGFRVQELFKGGGKEEMYVPVSERDRETGDLREGREVFPLEPEVESGGAGLYGSAEDFAEVVRALLRGLAGEEGEGLLLGKEMVEEMFTPQLDETQRKWLKGILLRFGAAPEFPEDMPVDHGIGGVMNMEDIPGKRRKGSMKWTGMANSHWWIDPQTGIGGILFVNVIPHGDPVVNKLYDELERVLYGELPPNLGITSSS